MQTERVGDFAQHQRAHCHFAMLEEMPLPVDDGLGHAQDGLETLLDVLDQPARLLQLRGHLAARTAIVLQDVGIHAVDAELGDRIRVQGGDPYILDLAHDDVGHDVAGFGLGICGPGPWIERLHQALRQAQLVIIAGEQAFQADEIARGQQ